MINTQVNIHHIKSNFSNNLSKGKLLNLKDMNLPLEKDFPLEVSLIRNWHRCINQLNFLNFNIPQLEEIFIHSPTNIVYKTFNTQFSKDSDITQEDLQLAYEILTLKNNISWNYKNPFVSFYYKHNQINLRISLTHFSISPNGLSKCFIRLVSNQKVSITKFSTLYTEDFFKDLMKQKKNILIAGSTGSGKTTFLNSLLSYSDPNEHLIILEDTNEIQVPHPNTTKLLADNSLEEKSLNTFMSYSMRMSPKRIVLGEIRSSEVESYLLAMNTGHNGLLSTVHANTAKDALERLALLFKIYSRQDLSYELVLKLVCNNINNVIFLDNKEIKEVINVFGSEKEQIFYESII